MVRFSDGSAWLRLASVALLSLSSFGCGAGSADDAASVGRARQPFLNCRDDRLEHYELRDPAQRSLVARSVVALMSARSAERLLAGDPRSLPTHAERDDLCEGQRFGEQPAAAFCSGVLVDRDLVLTSGHCVNVYAESELRVVFGYYLSAPGLLTLDERDVYRVQGVVSARRDPDGSSGTRLDYGWLRLAAPARSPHEPAAVHVQPPDAALGDPILTVGASAGVPLKIDPAGRLRDLREPMRDYFVADTDTSAGWSGGGAFDESLALLGNLARGEPDFMYGDDDCQVDATREDPTGAQEQFTYAYQAVLGLCAVDDGSGLCDPECEAPCQVAPSRPRLAGGGACSLRPGLHAARGSATPFALSLLAALGRRRRSRRKRST
jgi:hypothetical protein